MQLAWQVVGLVRHPSMLSMLPRYQVSMLGCLCMQAGEEGARALP